MQSCVLEVVLTRFELWGSLAPATLRVALPEAVHLELAVARRIPAADGALVARPGVAQAAKPVV